MKKLRSALALLLCLVLCLSLFPASAFAQEQENTEAHTVVDSGTCGAQGDNLSWTLYDDGGLVISGTGEMANYTDGPGYTDAPWFDSYNNRSDVRHVTVEEGVTSIGENAFAFCSDLTEAALPASLTEIAAYAFFDCYSLTAFTVDPANAAYASADGVLLNGAETALLLCPQGKQGSISVPSGVTSIADYAFAGCAGLTEITLPESLTNIGYEAFYGCGGLTELSIPSGATSIGNAAFSNCWSLTDITLPEGLTGVGEQMFYSCGSLTEITLPETVTSIGDSAFSNCESLTEIVLPETVTSIGVCAFYNCESLTGVTLPEGLAHIGTYAFENCGSLTDVWFGGSERQRNERMGEGEAWDTDGNGNDDLFYAQWHYAVMPTTLDVGSFAELKAAVQAHDGSETYVYYNGSDCFVIEETVTLPENFYFCADAEGSSVLIPAGVTLTVESSAVNAFYAESLSVEGAMIAHRSAVYYQTLSGEIDWIREIVDSGFCGAQGDNIGWTLYDDGELVISGTGAMADYISAGDDYSPAPWLDYFVCNPSRINTVTVEPGVTYIGDNAFSSGWGVTSVTLPEGLTVIGDGAFLSCSELRSLALPSSLTSIGDEAFISAGLTGLTIPAGVTYIGSDSFAMCASLTGLTVDPANSVYASVDGVLFNKAMTELLLCPMTRSGAYAVPQGVTAIGNAAFSYCGDLTEITLPSSLRSIDSGAFSGCGGLTEIALPEGLLSIGENAFLNCTGLTEITIPATVTDMGENPFLMCGNLTSISVDPDNGVYSSVDGVLYNKEQTLLLLCPGGISGSFQIPEHVTGIGAYAFSSCWELTGVSFPDSVTQIGEGAFQSCSGLTELALPAGLTCVSDRAFAFCRAITDISFPEGLTVIGDLAFNNCNALTELALPDGVTSIGEWAFTRCMNLTELVLPSDLTNIGEGAFRACSGLQSVTLPAGLTSIAPEVFSYCGSLSEVSFFGSERQRSEREGEGWSTAGNEALFNAAWHYGVMPTTLDVASFAELQAAVQAFDGNDTYVYYNGSDCFVIEETITLPENFYFCADAEGSSVLIPAGVTLTVESESTNAFYAEALSVEGTMIAHRSAVYYQTLSGEIDWVREIFDSGECGAQGDNVTWTLYEDGELVISGAGDMADFLLGSNPWWDYTDRVLTARVEPGVTRVGREGFVYLRNMTSITLPEGVTSTGEYAFMGCSSLTSITLPESLATIGYQAFTDCGSLTDVWFGGSERQRSEREGDGWSTAGNEALFGAAWHYGVMPTTLDVASFAELQAAVQAFDGNDTYVYYNGSDCFVIEETITLPENFYFCADAEGSSVLIPAGVTLTVESSAVNAFYAEELSVEGAMIAHRSAVYYQTLSGEIDWIREIFDSGECGAQGDNVTWTLYEDGELVIKGTGDMADFRLLCSAPWYDWRNDIRTVTVESGVTSIGMSAFWDCGGMTDVVLPASLTGIGDDAFHNCYSLTGIALPAGVTSIGSTAFIFCSGLMNITADQNNSVYSSVDGVLFDKTQTTLCFFPNGRSGSYSVPDGVTSIGNGAFEGGRLASVELPERLTSIGGYAFMFCGSLTEITIPTTVTGIGPSAFAECWSLTDITIPTGVTDIGSNAFYSCSALTDVWFGGTEAQRGEREGEGWSTTGNEALFNAAWHYAPVEPEYDCVLPASLTAIEEEALAGCAFAAVRIPDGVTSIGTKAFAGSPNLEYVYIPESVTEIAADAFYQVTGLTVIGKTGSPAESFADAQGFPFIAD